MQKRKSEKRKIIVVTAYDALFTRIAEEAGIDVLLVGDSLGVVVQGKKVQYTFDYHGRCEVEILGEESNGKLVPPRYRPRPKSAALARSSGSILFRIP